MRNRAKLVGVINRGGGLEKIVKKRLDRGNYKEILYSSFFL